FIIGRFCSTQIGMIPFAIATMQTKSCAVFGKADPSLRWPLAVVQIGFDGRLKVSSVGTHKQGRNSRSIGSGITHPVSLPIVPSNAPHPAALRNNHLRRRPVLAVLGETRKRARRSLAILRDLRPAHGHQLAVWGYAEIGISE